jgi:hypothetical protein
MKSFQAILLTIAVTLSAGGKIEASGVYVLANDEEVALVQIIEDKGTS